MVQAATSLVACLYTNTVHYTNSIITHVGRSPIQYRSRLGFHVYMCVARINVRHHQYHGTSAPFLAILQSLNIGLGYILDVSNPRGMACALIVTFPQPE
jgi:hypothetical protein